MAYAMITKAGPVSRSPAIDTARSPESLDANAPPTAVIPSASTPVEKPTKSHRSRSRCSASTSPPGANECDGAEHQSECLKHRTQTEHEELCSGQGIAEVVPAADDRPDADGDREAAAAS